jgi:hypothetical protein
MADSLPEREKRSILFCLCILDLRHQRILLRGLVEFRKGEPSDRGGRQLERHQKGGWPFRNSLFRQRACCLVWC